MAKRKNKNRYGDKPKAPEHTPSGEAIALPQAKSSDLLEAAKGVVANDIETMSDEEATAVEALLEKGISKEELDKMLADGVDVRALADGFNDGTITAEATEAEGEVEGKPLKAKRTWGGLKFLTEQNPDPKYFDTEFPNLDLKSVSDAWNAFCLKAYAWVSEQGQKLYAWAEATNAKAKKLWDEKIAPKLPKLGNSKAMLETINDRLESMNLAFNGRLEALNKRIDNMANQVSPADLTTFVKALQSGQKAKAISSFRKLTGANVADATAAIVALAPA